jgi:uncharacterized membrane protein YfcA
MILDLSILVLLALLSLAASVVNGGLGYGYSSISTPLAILVVINKVINPVYVLVEGIMNTVMLVLSGSSNVKSTFRRVLPIIAALIPAVVIGSIALTVIAPAWVRLLVYVTILPLILLQAAGLRRPIRSERQAGIPLGIGVGLLYSITTISGPPIALFFNNQGLVKSEFKAAIAQIRIVESYTTILAYFSLGLFTASTLQLFAYVAPPVLLGIPLGFLIVKRLGAELFRRLCMSFDAWIVGYGLAVVLGSLFGLIDYGYAIWGLVIGIDAMLLYRFFSTWRRRLTPKPASPSGDGAPGPAKLSFPPGSSGRNSQERSRVKQANALVSESSL